MTRIAKGKCTAANISFSSTSLLKYTLCHLLLNHLQQNSVFSGDQTSDGYSSPAVNILLNILSIYLKANLTGQYILYSISTLLYCSGDTLGTLSARKYLSHVHSCNLFPSR